MKNLSLPLLLLCLLLSCSSDNDGPDGPGTIGSGVPVYDETLLPESEPPLPNLLSNGDFESDDAWISCGGVRYEPRDFATSGDQVLVMDARSVCEDGSDRSIVAAATQEIDLPGGISDVLTISFQVRAEGPIPSLAFDLYLSNAVGASFQFFGGYRITSIVQEADEAPSWNLITLLVTRSQVENAIEASPLFLTFQFRGSDEAAATTIYLDDVRVTNGFRGTTQAAAMPDALTNYAGDSRILFYKITTEDQTVASLRPNGTDMVVHDQIPAATVEGAPRWFERRPNHPGAERVQPQIAQ